MGKKIAIDISTESVITITNVYGTEDYQKYRVSSKSVDMIGDQLEGMMFATGAASLGDPHVDEFDQMGKVFVDETNAFDGLHAFALRLFGGNQYVTLLPGDSIKIKAVGNAAAYYAMIKADGIKVEADPVVVTPGDDRGVDEGPVFTDDGDEPVLDRGTGVGDDAAINFNGKEVTDEMNKVADKSNETEDNTTEVPEGTPGTDESEQDKTPGQAGA